MSLRILGTGSALPARQVSNEELSGWVDTSDEWISTRTGIRQRRVLTGGESLASLGAQAAERALHSAGAAPADIDLVVCTTVRGDAVTPALACLIAQRLGLSCPAMDVNAACAGFVYALDMAAAYLESGRARRMLLVSAEAMSALTDWTDRSSCVLFGDGAGAVVAEAGEDLLTVRLTCAPSDQWLRADAPLGNCPLRPGEKNPYLRMNGQEVYKFAVSSTVRDLRDLLAGANLEAGQIDWYLLHQANLRIIEAARQRVKQPREKFPTIIERTGNISSASIPVLLDALNRQGKLKPGQLLFLSAFGAGLSTGAALLRWSGCTGQEP